MARYIGHPNRKVARASHTLFVAFLSSAKESEEDERNQLKEDLVYYYMERSLEVPKLTEQWMQCSSFDYYSSLIMYGSGLS